MTRRPFLREGPLWLLTELAGIPSGSEAHVDFGAFAAIRAEALTYQPCPFKAAQNKEFSRSLRSPDLPVVPSQNRGLFDDARRASLACHEGGAMDDPRIVDRIRIDAVGFRANGSTSYSPRGIG
jgi:hypothetical protein